MRTSLNNTHPKSRRHPPLTCYDLELDCTILGREIYSKSKNRTRLDHYEHVKIEAEKLIKKHQNLRESDATHEKPNEKNKTLIANIHYNYSVFLHQLLLFYHSCYREEYANNNYEQASTYLQDAASTSAAVIEQTNRAYELYSVEDQAKTLPDQTRNTETFEVISAQIKDIKLLLNKKIPPVAHEIFYEPVVNNNILSSALQEPSPQDWKGDSSSASKILTEQSLPPKKRYKTISERLSATVLPQQSVFAPKNGSSSLSSVESFDKVIDNHSHLR